MILYVAGCDRGEVRQVGPERLGPDGWGGGGGPLHAQLQQQQRQLPHQVGLTIQVCTYVRR